MKRLALIIPIILLLSSCGDLAFSQKKPPLIPQDTVVSKKSLLQDLNKQRQRDVDEINAIDAQLRLLNYIKSDSLEVPK